MSEERIQWLVDLHLTNTGTYLDLELVLTLLQQLVLFRLQWIIHDFGLRYCFAILVVYLRDYERNEIQLHPCGTVILDTIKLVTSKPYLILTCGE